MSKDEASNPYADYSYAAMSNLVTRADRRHLPRQVESTGEPETLSGRINIRDMGSRTGASPAASSISNRNVGQLVSKKRTKTALPHNSILDATSGLEGIVYRPSTVENRTVFDALLATVSGLLGDQSPDVVRSAGDLVLEVLQSDAKELDKRRQIESALDNAMSEADFLRLGQLSRKITDFETHDTINTSIDTLAQDTGIAVIIDENEASDSVSESDDTASQGSYEEIESEPSEFDTNDQVIRVQKQVNKESNLVRALDIDGFWLQRKIAGEYPPHTDAHLIQEQTASAMSLLSSPVSSSVLENDLMDLFNYDKFRLVQTLLENRNSIVWCTKLARAQDTEKDAVRKLMQERGLSELLGELDGKTSAIREQQKFETPQEELLKPKPSLLRALNLENLIFSEGNHLMSNKKVSLPEGSFRRTHATYEEVHVPAPKKASDAQAPNISISDLPDWTHAAFANTASLNRIQSAMFQTAFRSEENILLCAPTGAGKTNVAMLCILQELAKHRQLDGQLNLSDFKIVYIAPLKALVSEMVGNFSSRLATYGISVAELTGDSQLTKQQIASTSIIVTTPEKWDVITRKATDASYTALVRLIIIDEIHLLHDARGPVLESIVCRVHRKVEEGSEPVRLVGLSATLPNFADVASFLRVDTDKGLFYFDQSYRPCPLKQEFIGISEKKPIKRLQILNNVCYEKVLESVSKQNQVLVFVHSRKETYKTAKHIRDQALEHNTIQRILKTDAASKEILVREAESVRDSNLRELLPYGLAMHHAGMTKADRTTAEDLFAEGLIQVLVSTATLAWGVNLPAHTVIIKGTQVYSPENGAWIELSPQDVLQMLGRAGRPQYDTYGEGIILTNQSELQYYLSLINQQLPIESQFVSKLVDNMNAEIVLNTIRSREDAVMWLGYTYLYVRMLNAPALYKVGADNIDDEKLIQKRIDLVHSAATELAKCNLIKYDIDNGTFLPTELGRIASHYYITFGSMKTYNAQLKPGLSMIELFSTFALSEEFKYIPVREDEKLEIAKLLERTPVPVRESTEEPACKINVLLQAHISRLRLDGFALAADMIYVTQSAGRIMRCIFEICLKRAWAQVARLTLQMCKMIEYSLWSTRLPLAQFEECPQEILRKLERKEFPWSKYFDLDPHELGELTGDSRSGRLVHRLVHQFPRLQIQANVQPITRSLLRVELSITPDFQWNDSVHGGAELFWILVEDVDGERLLYHDRFILKKQYSSEDHNLDFTIPVTEPVPPHYFVSLVSDRWLHAETKVTVPLRHMTLPGRFPAYTAQLELHPLPLNALRNSRFEELYTQESFNLLQTQTFNTIFHTNDSVLIGSPKGTGKIICAELAILRLWSLPSSGRAVYLNPKSNLVDQQFPLWSEKFSRIGKTVSKLSNDGAANLKLVQMSDLILATPQQWDEFSRRWQQRKTVQSLSLLVLDHLHEIGGKDGSIYETVASRSRYIAAQTEVKLRIIGLCVPLADPRDVRDWLGVPSQAVFNFDPTTQMRKLELHLQAYDNSHYPSFMLALAKPLNQALKSMSRAERAIVYVSSRKQCRDTALDVLLAATADGSALELNNASEESHVKLISTIEEKTLAESIGHGIAYFHDALSSGDKRIVLQLYRSYAVRLLIASRDCLYSIDTHSELVVILGTQSYEGSQHRYIDYPVSEVLYMIGSPVSEDCRSRVFLMTSTAKKEYYRKFLEEALPVESQYLSFIHDDFITEIASQAIESKQEAVDWLTWSFFYRRLSANPSFYGLEHVENDQVSGFLSDLVETTLSDLTESKMIEIAEDDMGLAIMNLGLISSHYAISYISMQTFALSLTERTKLKGLLEIVTSATEFDDLPVRRHENIVLRRIYDRVPVKLDINFEDPHHKAFILLQAHFSRIQLPSDLRSDLNSVLTTIVKLLSACVDVMSSEGQLNALNAMELSQMCIQAIWDRDSPLKQIPYFDDDVLARCQAAKIEDVTQIADLDDEERDTLLQMNGRQLNAVAKFCNQYPDISMSCELADPDSLIVGEPSMLQVKLEREIEEDEELDISVVAPHYPEPRSEHWWLVLSDSKTLLGIKKVTLQRMLSVQLEFVPTTPGDQEYTLSFLSDSYTGIDQEQTIVAQVALNTHEADLQPEDENHDTESEDKMQV